MYSKNFLIDVTKTRTKIQTVTSTSNTLALLHPSTAKPSQLVFKAHEHIKLKYFIYSQLRKATHNPCADKLNFPQPNCQNGK